MTKKCHYHPPREAVTVCARCSRNLCFDDKRLYRYQHSSSLGVGIGELDITSVERTLDYCILCNATQLRNDINPLKIIYIFLPFLVFAFIIVYLFPPSALLFGSFIFVFIILWIFQVKKARAAENEAMIFKESLKTDEYSRTYGFLTSKRGLATIDDHAQIDIYSSRQKKVGTRRPSKERIFHMVCWQCSTKLELTDKFCPKCGDPIHKS